MKIHQHSDNIRHFVSITAVLYASFFGAVAGSIATAEQNTDNKAKAFKCYRKDAEQGNARTQWLLGLCYENGEGVNEDLTEAVKWYRLAADQGGMRWHSVTLVCAMRMAEG